MDKLKRAPDGQIWVCSACGKRGKDATKVGDESCFRYAMLCWEDSMRVDEKSGLVVFAEMVTEGERVTHGK